MSIPTLNFNLSSFQGLTSFDKEISILGFGIVITGIACDIWKNNTTPTLNQSFKARVSNIWSSLSARISNLARQLLMKREPLKIVKEPLDLSGKYFEALPPQYNNSNLTIQGSLYLRNCTCLIALPAKLEVKGDLDLIECISLTKLPTDLKVEGLLDLTGCSALTELPENLKVGGSIYLTGCSPSIIIPKHLEEKILRV